MTGHPGDFGERDAPLIAPSTGYEIAAWRDGPVGSDVPVTAVCLNFKMRAGDMASYLLAVEAAVEDEMTVGVRLKSRREVSRLIGLLSRYADEVWPEATP